jgi:hypothetical protein
MRWARHIAAYKRTPPVMQPRAPTDGVNDLSRDVTPPAIFSESWWREITTKQTRSRQIEVAINSRVVGRMTFELRNHGILLTTGAQSPLTHTLDLIVDEEGNSDHGSRFDRQYQIAQSLIKQLPQRHSYEFTLHQNTGAGVIAAFRDAGFVLSFQENFEIPLSYNSQKKNERLEDETGEPPVGVAGRVWEEVSGKLRTKIRKASRRFQIDMDTGPSEFFDFYEKNLREKGIRSYFELQTGRKLLDKCCSVGQLSIMTAIDQATGIAHSSSACVFDKTNYYYFLQTNTIDADHDALRLLIWNQIKRAVQGNRVWDFDGVPNTNENIKRKYQEFCPIAAHRPVLRRQTALMRGYTALRSRVR